MPADVSGIWIDGKSASGEWLRLLTTAPFLAGNSPLGLRGGVRYTPGEPGQVTKGPAAWQVTVAPFVCVIPSTTGAKTGGYVLASRTPATLTLAAPHPSQDRVDLIVARVTDTGTVDSTYTVEPVAGTPQVGPAQPPTVPDNAIVLAAVQIPAGASALGQVADQRTWLDAPTPPRANALLEATATTPASTNSLPWQILASPAVAFTAPPSGRVSVVVSARMRVASSGWIAASARIAGPSQYRRDPNVVDELRSHTIADDSGGQNAGIEFAVSGLLPGEAYQALFVVRVNLAATVGWVADRRIIVKPVV